MTVIAAEAAGGGGRKRRAGERAAGPTAQLPPRALPTFGQLLDVEVVFAVQVTCDKAQGPWDATNNVPTLTLRG